MSATAETLCPKCSTARLPGALECPHCGVIYARYQSRPKAAALAPVSAAPGNVALGNAAPAAAAPVERREYLAPDLVETLLTQLAEMVEAGLTVRQALTGGVLATLPPTTARRLERGATQDLPLSEILEPLELLDAPALAMVRAGEQRGGLPAALRHITQRIAERRADRRKLTSTLTYPTLLLLSAAIIMPAPSIFTHSVLTYASRVLPSLLALGGAITLFFLWPRFRPDSTIRRVASEVARSIPITRKIARDGAVSTFAEVLGASVSAGVPVREGLSMAARATPDPTFQRGAGRAVQHLDDGHTLAEALATLDLPANFLAQVNAAELSGTLDRALPRLATTYRESSRTGTVRFLVVLGITVMLVVAISAAISIVSGFKTTVNDQDKLFEQLLHE